MVDELNDGHGAHEEEQRGGSRAEVMLNLLTDDQGFGIADGCCQILCRIDHEEGPAYYEHQQRDSGLVHFRHTFDGNEEIADNEGDDDGNC